MYLCVRPSYYVLVCLVVLWCMLFMWVLIYWMFACGVCVSNLCCCDLVVVFYMLFVCLFGCWLIVRSFWTEGDVMVCCLIVLCWCLASGWILVACALH